MSKNPSSAFPHFSHSDMGFRLARARGAGRQLASMWLKTAARRVSVGFGLTYEVGAASLTFREKPHARHGKRENDPSCAKAFRRDRQRPTPAQTLRTGRDRELILERLRSSKRATATRWDTFGAIRLDRLLRRGLHERWPGSGGAVLFPKILFLRISGTAAIALGAFMASRPKFLKIAIQADY